MRTTDAEETWESLAESSQYSAARLADQCGMSIRRLEREFIDEFGLSLLDWLNELKLNAAYDWLKKGRPLRALIVRLGYREGAQFRRAFRERFGIEPEHLAGSSPESGWHIAA